MTFGLRNASDFAEKKGLLLVGNPLCIVANFRVAGAFSQTVAVQAKYWKPDPPVGKKVVKQLIQGIEAEEAVLGLVITTGTIAEDAERQAEDYFDETGIRIELLDGKQFAKVIVELGISPSVSHDRKR
jgi:restriction endonuclease Mrr